MVICYDKLKLLLEFESIHSNSMSRTVSYHADGMMSHKLKYISRQTSGKSQGRPRSTQAQAPASMSHPVRELVYQITKPTFPDDEQHFHFQHGKDIAHNDAILQLEFLTTRQLFDRPLCESKEKKISEKMSKKT